MTRLLDLLREHLHLTGTKEGCGEGECGACAVLLNGELVNSCLIPALQVDGATVLTIEGLAPPASTLTQQGVPTSVSPLRHLAPIQRCFLESGGAQCGICTPGMILATHSLLERHPQPTQSQIAEGLGGNLCRCTGYMRIFEAVEQAAAELSRTKVHT